MSYEYEKEKKVLFTDEGQKMLLRIRDHSQEIMKKAGAAKLNNMIAGASGGDSFHMLACVDRLLELGEIREVSTESSYSQDRVFVPA